MYEDIQPKPLLLMQYTDNGSRPGPDLLHWHYVYWDINTHCHSSSPRAMARPSRCLLNKSLFRPTVLLLSVLQLELSRVLREKEESRSRSRKLYPKTMTFKLMRGVQRVCIVSRTMPTNTRAFRGSEHLFNTWSSLTVTKVCVYVNASVGPAGVCYCWHSPFPLCPSKIPATVAAAMNRKH